MGTIHKDTTRFQIKSIDTLIRTLYNHYPT